MTRPTLPRRQFLGGLALAPILPALSSPRSAAAEGDRIWTVGVVGDTARGAYGHGLDTVWLGLPETRIVAVADPVEEGRAKAAERLGLAPVDAYADYRKMLAAAQPDVVAVCPRHVDQHHDMILAAVESGAKALYVEKPFCRDLAEADAIVAACREAGTKLALAHRNRYHPAVPTVAKMVEEGAIGRWLEIRARGKEDQRGGGLDLWVLGSHLLNLCHYFAGAPLACSATLLNDGRPATAADVVEGAEGVGPLAGNEVRARFETESGVPVYFDSLAGAGTRENGFGLQLVGTEGVIDLRGDAEPLFHYMEGSPFQPGAAERRWVPVSSAGPGQPEPVDEIRRFVAGHWGPVRDLLASVAEDRAPLCSDEDGRTILEMTFGVFESHRSGGRRVELPLARRDNPLARLG